MMPPTRLVIERGDLKIIMVPSLQQAELLVLGY
jgi:hypothetical protein